MAAHLNSDNVDPLVVFHGTTAASAEQIAQVGFQPLDRGAVLTEVAQAYGVPVGQLVGSLESMGRMVVGLRNRVRYVSAATTVEGTWSWANRAPEARWEALWGVWWATHGTDEWGPWTNPAVAACHLRQRLADAPVAIEVHVPGTELRSPGGDRYTVEEARRCVANEVIEVQFAPRTPPHG